MGTTILRDYQQQIYDEIPRKLAAHDSVLVYSPMRSGKSKIISATVERIIEAATKLIEGGRVPIVLTHRDKIFKQLIEHCNGIPINAKTSHVFIEPKKCFVAMQQTMIKRPFILSQLEQLGNRIVLLVDEAHVGNFNKIFDLIPAALRIGFSATPAWKWAKFLPKYYKSFIHGPQISSLITSGNFVPVEYHEMVSDLEGLKKQANGEYTEQSNEIVFDRAKLYDGLFVELDRFTFNKCTIFCASKKSADKLYNQFVEHANSKWKPVVYYSGKKIYELARFTELNDANVLITVRSLGTGWDYPPLNFNVLWCAMGSLLAYLQTGARPCTPHPGKPLVTILDFGGNNSRFGGNLQRIALTMDRDWNALSQPPDVLPKTKSGVGAIQYCPACEFIISAVARSCCNCGYIFPEAEVKLKEGELAQIIDAEQAQTAAVQANVGRRISTLNAVELALYAKERNRKALCMRVAKAQQISRPMSNFVVDYGKAMGYNNKWADRILIDQAQVLQYEPDYKIPFNDIIIR